MLGRLKAGLTLPPVFEHCRLDSDFSCLTLISVTSPPVYTAVMSESGQGDDTQANKAKGV